MSQVAKTRILWLMGPNSVSQQAKRLNREGHDSSVGTPATLLFARFRPRRC
jgi:hypothetical protein